MPLLSACPCPLQEVEQWIAAWRAANVDPPLSDSHVLPGWPGDAHGIDIGDGIDVGDDISVVAADAIDGSSDGGVEALAPGGSAGDSNGSPDGPDAPAPAPLVLAAPTGPAAIVRVTEPHLPPHAADALSGAADTPPALPAAAAAAIAASSSTSWQLLGLPVERVVSPGVAGQAHPAQGASPAAKRRRAARPVPVVRPQPPSLAARLAAVAAVAAPAARPAGGPAGKPSIPPTPSASPSGPPSAKDLEAAYKQRIAAVLADSKLSAASAPARRPAAAAGPPTSPYQARSRVRLACRSAHSRHLCRGTLPGH